MPASISGKIKASASPFMGEFICLIFIASTEQDVIKSNGPSIVHLPKTPASASSFSALYERVYGKWRSSTFSEQWIRATFGHSISKA